MRPRSTPRVLKTIKNPAKFPVNNSLDGKLTRGIEWGSFRFRIGVRGKRRMQKTHTSTNPLYVPCSRCGKPTFSDLLDGEGMCDYCREVRSMKAAVVRKREKGKGRE